MVRAWWRQRAGSSGGMVLADGKAATEHRPVQAIPTPARLFVPLSQGDEAPAEARVLVGDAVATGDVIATPSAEDQALLHAPLDANVTQLTTVDTPYRERVPAIELTSSAMDKVPAAAQSVELPECFPQGLFARLKTAGVQVDDMSRPMAPPLDHLIVNGLESEPLQTSDLRRLIEHTAEIVETTQWLQQTLRARRGYLVVDRSRRALFRRLRGSARGTSVRVVGLANKYPLSVPPLIVRAITGREVPVLGRPTDVGARVVDVRSLLDIRRAVGASVPHTRNLITVAGNAVPLAGNYWIPIGTPIDAVAAAAGLQVSARRIVADSLLSGPAVRSGRAVVTKRTRMLVFLTTDSPPERDAMACFRCGLCQDHCPVGIDPLAVLNLVERRRFDLAADQHPEACLDCGLCDYVCPSSLPLMRAIRRSRRHETAL